MRRDKIREGDKRGEEGQENVTKGLPEKKQKRACKIILSPSHYHSRGNQHIGLPFFLQPPRLKMEEQAVPQAKDGWKDRSSAIHKRQKQTPIESLTREVSVKFSIIHSDIKFKMTSMK